MTTVCRIHSTSAPPPLDAQVDAVVAAVGAARAARPVLRGAAPDAVPDRVPAQLAVPRRGLDTVQLRDDLSRRQLPAHRRNDDRDRDRDDGGAAPGRIPAGLRARLQGGPLGAPGHPPARAGRRAEPDRAHLRLPGGAGAGGDHQPRSRGGRPGQPGAPDQLAPVRQLRGRGCAVDQLHHLHRDTDLRRHEGDRLLADRGLDRSRRGMVPSDDEDPGPARRRPASSSPSSSSTCRSTRSSRRRPWWAAPARSCWAS